MAATPYPYRAYTWNNLLRHYSPEGEFTTVDDACDCLTRMLPTYRSFCDHGIVLDDRRRTVARIERSS